MFQYDKHGVCLCAGFCCLYLNFFLIFSPNSSCKRQRSHTNQLTVLALFNTPRHRRGRRERKQTPITVRHEEGDLHVWALFVIMCFLLYSQTKQEGQWSFVHREDTSIEFLFSSLKSEPLVEFNSLVPVSDLDFSSNVLFSFKAFNTHMSHSCRVSVKRMETQRQRGS